MKDALAGNQKKNTGFSGGNCQVVQVRPEPRKKNFPLKAGNRCLRPRSG